MNRSGPPSDAAPSRGPDGPAFLSRLRARDEAAFEELVRAYGGRLLATAARILGNDEDARDATQDAFLSAFRSIDRFEGGSLTSTWLHRIVINAALMKLRSRRRKPEGRIEDPPVEWKEPSDLLIHRRETRQMVRECIERLPETYRTVLVLRDIEELDTDETAKLLGVSTNAVKTRLHRARQALRTLLDPHFRESAP
jgi:RNA polymerase sigma-70 factor (ECF subfamily)